MDLYSGFCNGWIATDVGTVQANGNLHWRGRVYGPVKAGEWWDGETTVRRATVEDKMKHDRHVLEVQTLTACARLRATDWTALAEKDGAFVRRLWEMVREAV